MQLRLPKLPALPSLSQHVNDWNGFCFPCHGYNPIGRYMPAGGNINARGKEISLLNHPYILGYKGEVEIPYSGKIWRALNLANWLKTARF